jgi:hypothetical protein
VIIDMSDWLSAERKPPTAENATAETPAQPSPPRATLEPTVFGACQHKRISIDDKQRTVKCGDCKMWLDPVWCLRELFRYYEQRVDWRLARIEEYEKREKEHRERREARAAAPRRAKAETMQHHLERAARNEYQSKVLAARALAQRFAAEKIERELTAEDGRG